jgi:NMD protein affecting ribosome stability and mRNA decay
LGGKGNMRIDRNIKEREHDPYVEGRKYPEGIYCSECHAVYQEGRWVWPEKPSKIGEASLCSACRRIRDDFPAGVVYLTGSYLKNHGNEIEHLVQNIVNEAKARSPLKRIINILKEKEGGICVRLTDDHLARHIGDAVHRAYKGDLQVKYSDEEKFVRLYWHRDE